MLLDPVLRALDDLQALRVLVDASDHGLLRDERVEPVKDAGKVVALDVRLRESGAVIVADVQKAFLHLRRQVDCRVDGQVAALGVTAEAELLVGVLPQQFERVVERLHLGRDIFHEGHVEVFLPADQRGVRAAIRDVQRVVRQVQCDGSKLDDRVLVVVFDEIRDREFIETVRFVQQKHEPRIAIETEFVRRQRFQLFAEAPDRFVRAEQDLLERHIRKPGQDQTVEFVERDARKRKVTSPV